VGRVTQTGTGSRNKVEFGTIGPVPLEEIEETQKTSEGDDTLGDLAF